MLRMCQIYRIITLLWYNYPQRVVTCIPVFFILLFDIEGVRLILQCDLYSGKYGIHIMYTHRNPCQ